MIDFATPIAVRVSIEHTPRVPDARKGAVEFGLTDEKCEMLVRRVGGISEVKRDAVCEAHGYEPAPLRPGLDPQNVGEEPRRCPFILRAEDYMIKFDSHPYAPGSYARRPTLPIGQPICDAT